MIFYPKFSSTRSHGNALFMRAKKIYHWSSFINIRANRDSQELLAELVKHAKPYVLLALYIIQCPKYILHCLDAAVAHGLTSVKVSHFFFLYYSYLKSRMGYFNSSAFHHSQKERWTIFESPMYFFLRLIWSFKTCSTAINIHNF